MSKPKCNLIGQDGNVFNLIALVSKALRKAGLNDEAKKFVSEAMQSPSYEAVLVLIGDYVEIT